MICTNCRHENESNSTFCTKCGRSLLNDRLMADENTLELLEKRISLIENLLSKYITEGILSKEELDSITDTGIPAFAKLMAMPPPIVPHPITTLLSIFLSGVSLVIPGILFAALSEKNE